MINLNKIKKDAERILKQETPRSLKRWVQKHRGKKLRRLKVKKCWEWYYEVKECPGRCQSPDLHSFCDDGCQLAQLVKNKQKINY